MEGKIKREVLKIHKKRDKDYPWPSMVQLKRGKEKQWYVRCLPTLIPYIKTKDCFCVIINKKGIGVGIFKEVEKILGKEYKMIKPNENIFKYVQSKHVVGILSGLIGSLSIYIEPKIIISALKDIVEQLESENSILRKIMEQHYNSKNELRTDYEPQG